MTAFTVIAYRANGVDTCRNCVMGQSDSDFEFQAFASLEEAASFKAEKLLSEPSGREYCSWEFTLLVDGLDSDAWWRFHGESELDEPPFSEFDSLVDARVAELNAAAAERAELARVEAERKATLERLRLRRVQDAHELAEYQRLQAKFG